MMGGDDDDGDTIVETQEISSENLFHFACWMHVFSEAELRISVHEKSSLLAAEFEKVC